MTTKTTTTTTTTILDQVDHVANRVGVCSVIGLLGGAMYSTWRGTNRRSSSIKMCVSWTLVGTALFATERIGYLIFRPIIHNNTTTPSQNSSNNRRILLTSHAFSGISGGGLLGYLYQKQPIRGMVVFTPVMLSVALCELYWKNQKEQRIAQLLRQRQRNKTSTDV